MNNMKPWNNSIWLLAKECGFFLRPRYSFLGGMLFAYTVYRRTYPEAFVQMSQQFSWLFGTINTAVLLTSSLTMALAVRAAQRGKVKLLTLFLSLTLLLGVAFLTIKGFEYAEDFSKGLFLGSSFQSNGRLNGRFQGPITGHMQILLFLYYVMTAIHGVHLLIGICVVGVMISKSRKNEFTSDYYSPVEITGLYWHFVDIVWIFLYPLLYLIGKPIL